ncbi:gastrula zinc finger protein XlCGF66.1-like [Spea bombifrons]|uniref:gastrula zinc finger protein XlCGF66.1-like n=1 Tax=Spea bombifrons TaxID=233779 RepID=UPI0023495849|nr:gastrula zinc finger protein XlCGF66.1-like [Spea bombifrons]
MQGFFSESRSLSQSRAVKPLHNSEMTAKDGGEITEKILRLTLEIICVLTGEDYIVVRKPGVKDRNRSGKEKLCAAQGPIVDPLPNSPTRKDNLLEPASKMLHVLTREVPVRYEDVAVILSMEEWEYLEGHKDLYKDVIMEKKWPLNSRGKCAFFGDLFSME